MDKTDQQILCVLEENSRVPPGDLAVMAGCSEEEAGRRVRALEEAGVIRGYITVIDWDQAGNGEVFAIIDLKVSPERDHGYDRIAERISRFRQVRSLRLVTGAYDLQLIVSGRNMHEVARFVSEHIAPMDRIRETATHIIMKTYKESGSMFCSHEGHERIPFSF